MFKTDDDSFVDVNYLNEFLLRTSREEGGGVPRFTSSLTQGSQLQMVNKSEIVSGKVLSKILSRCRICSISKDCAAGLEDHLAHMQFMPFEDTAVDLLAERCGLESTKEQ
mmetsp:Transcript_3047/g.6183  ORF Transcript_3047/g.6183 Transcript_3047/m.6183 type:complete len:110 (+) Transcript_3047:387-716(+)